MQELVLNEWVALNEGCDISSRYYFVVLSAYHVRSRHHPPAVNGSSSDAEQVLRWASRIHPDEPADPDPRTMRAGVSTLRASGLTRWRAAPVLRPVVHARRHAASASPAPPSTTRTPPTPIVSSYLICGTPRHARTVRVLLLRRSGAVSPHPGRWSVCVGRIEPTDGSPREAATREILEELGAGVAARLRLVRTGEPFDIVSGKDDDGFEYDRGEVRRWRTHPFVWDVREPSGKEEGDASAERVELVLGPEHQEARWVSLQEMDDMDTVPGLAATLRQMLDESHKRRDGA